MALRNAKARL